MSRHSSDPPSQASPDATAAGILLAAGLSSRMGQTKPLLPWDGRTLIAYQVAQLHEAGVGDVVVVVGHDAGRVAAAARSAGARVVVNRRYLEGRAGSVRAGALALRDESSAVVLLSADQPRPSSLTRRLLEEHVRRGAAITVPRLHARRGHPTVLAGSLLDELRAVSEETEGLRAIIRAHADEINDVDVTDPRALLDVNTPEAYRDARRAFGLEPCPE
ncbi:MAG: nucleotidyltransferase family protein [Chloroflexi bacterium]|nr:nucleotidyltransferase family protein [Chloroflexota bacterium]